MTDPWNKITSLQLKLSLEIIVHFFISNAVTLTVKTYKNNDIPNNVLLRADGTRAAKPLAASLSFNVM